MGIFSFLTRGRDEEDVELPPPEKSTRDILDIVYSDRCECHLAQLREDIGKMTNIFPPMENDFKERSCMRQDSLVSMAVYTIFEEYPQRFADKNDHEIFNEIFAQLVKMNRSGKAPRWATLVAASDPFAKGMEQDFTP